MLECVRHQVARVSIARVAAALTLALLVVEWKSVYFAYREPPMWAAVLATVLCLGLMDTSIGLELVGGRRGHASVEWCARKHLGLGTFD